MITLEYCRVMARYNAWQNRNLYDAAGGLSDTDRHRDMGAFFGSIHGTLTHLLWGDMMWMSRFDGWEKPRVRIQESPSFIEHWEALSSQREETDRRILDWADRLEDGWLSGDLTWWSSAAEREVTKPVAQCVAHFFNHQTHHRGQVHAMLTGAGRHPGDTDLFLMPASI